jgi:hypothetical protein
MSKRAPSHPPEPPEVKRVGHFYPANIIGMLALAVLPLLALLGVFNEQVSTASASAPGLSVEVRYLTRTRFSLPVTLHIVVENRTEAPLTGLTVSIDRAYLEGFRSVQSMPDVMRTTPDSLEIDLADLAPGEAQVIEASMNAVRIGSHRGEITVRAEIEGSEGAAEVAIETLVLP